MAPRRRRPALAEASTPAEQQLDCGEMPATLVQFGAIVLFLGGLIFVHELGHFVVAKALKVKVLRFSIGFGPRLFGFQRGETEYCISAFPLGGYVKMAGELGEEPEQLAPEDRGRGFLEQSPWRRLAIAVAGPLANLVFPGVVYLALAIAENGQPTPGPFIGTVAPGSAAAVAGLLPGDRILSVAAPGEAARPVRRFGDLRALVAPHPDVPLVFRVERDGKELPPLTIVPTSTVDRNPYETTRRGMLGVAATYAPAVVAPARPGAAGPLEPFDLVIAAGGVPVRHLGELQRAVSTARCAPIDLDVIRERPIALPGATLADPRTVKLAAVPTCDAERRPAFLSAEPTLSTFVAAVEPGSPADRAGIRRGDAIASVNGKRVLSFADINALSAEFLPQPAPPSDGSTPERADAHEVRLGLADGRTVVLVPAKERYVDEVEREERVRWVLGFQPERRRIVDAAALVVAEVPMQRSVEEIAAHSWDQLRTVVRLTGLGIVKILTGQISFKSVGGPLMLFSIASDAAEEGFSTFLLMMALISVNLGLMNLLPIPVLDGGNIAQALLEAITRRQLSARARLVAQGVGLALLVTLMLFVFKNDIVRLMG
jgi:regulator of sigma E protease